MASESVYTGQVAIAATGVPQRLPSSGPLNNGALFNVQGGNMSVDTNPNGTGAIDGTGTGLVVAEDTIPMLVAVKNTDALYITGTQGDVFSWAAW